MFKILFVCRANQCRSAMAEALMRDLLKKRFIDGIEVHSAGTHAADGIGPLPKVIEVCNQCDIDIASHKSYALVEELVIDSDLILVMENNQVDFVVKGFPKAKDKVKMLSSYSEQYEGQDIKDPIGGSIFGFRTTLAILNDCLDGLLDNVLKNLEN